MDSSKNRFSSFQQLLRNTGRLNRLIWPERKGQISAIIFLFGLVSFTPFMQSGAVALLINQLVEQSGGHTLTSGILSAVALLIIASALPTFLITIGNYLEKIFYLYMEEKFEIMIAARKGDIDVAAHEDPKQQDLFSKVDENGVWRMQNFADRQIFISQNIIEVVIASAVIVLSEPWIFLLLLLGTLPELFIEAKYGDDLWGMYGANAEVRRRYWDLKGHFQRVSTLIELKVMQNVGRFVNEMRSLFRDFQNKQRKQEQQKVVQQIFGHFVAQAVIAFAVSWFIYEVIRGSMQIGTLTFVLASIAGLQRALSSLFTNLGKQYQDSLFVSDVFAVEDTPRHITLPENPVIITSQTPEITFEKVSFAYPGTDRLVLKDVSFTIKPGEKIGLIGINGAGKTTLVKLLCRFYDPTSGRVLIDGHDLKNVDLASWYTRMGIIFQEYAHYNFPVKQAIAMGDTSKKLNFEQVETAAKAAQADEFIREWKQGYDQMLGRQFTDGVEPSIGQWQKLALARIFYRSPGLLILDEPTASIDAEAEAKIFEQLEKLPDNRSGILISHRFSTVRNADKIVVINEGRVGEMGTHNELMKLNKNYARLFKLQAKGYSEIIEK